MLFRPPLGEMIAVSPDGQRIACTSQNGNDLRLVIMDLAPPWTKRTVKLEAPRDANGVPDTSPVRLRLLRWASGSRLLYGPVERIVPLPSLTDKNGHTTPNPDGPTIVSPIFVVDIDGRERGTLIDASNFQETPESARSSLADLLRTPKQLAVAHNGPVGWRMPHLEVIGFLPHDREQLVLQTHGAYSMPMQHLVDLRTGDVREFGGNWPAPPGEPQVFDSYRLKVVGEHKDAARPTTAWRDDELARLQRELEGRFPHRVVEIIDWSETRTRVLFRVTGGSDPGRIFVLQRPEDVMVEVFQRAPWLGGGKLDATRFFEFDAAGGPHLSGYVTWPAKRPTEPPPLLVIFPTGFPGKAPPAFDPEAQVFADQGFVVLRLNHRSVGGVAAKDLTPLRAAVDRVSIDDARVTIDWLAARYPDRLFDRTHVAALGHGFGGYLALRALQLQPEVFRSGIAIDAPTELRGWLQLTKDRADIPVALIDHAGADWKKLSALTDAAALTAPVMLLVESSRNAAVDASTAELRAELTRHGHPADFVELDPGFGAAQPVARANTYRKIEEFLNVRLLGRAPRPAPAEENK